MNILDYFQGTGYEWLIVPIFIFIARIIDVSIGTVRIILIGKGKRLSAAILGFFEVFVWILAIGQIMQNLNNIWNYFSYALGFAAGTYLGIVFENMLSIGNVLVRIITKKSATELLEYLIIQDYALTIVDAEGRLGEVKIIFMIIERKKLKQLVQTVKRFNPNAFYSIQDVRNVNDSTFPKDSHPFTKKISSLMKFHTTRK